eukprot:scaffold249959_cov15-Tisochrysis_lutea.AAC.1
MGSLDMLLPWHGITGHAPWHVPPRDNAAYVDFISVWKIGEAWLVEAPGPALEGAACLAGAELLSASLPVREPFLDACGLFLAGVVFPFSAEKQLREAGRLLPAMPP